MHNHLKINQKGFGATESLLVLIILGIVGLVGWYVLDSSKKSNEALDNSTVSTLAAADRKAYLEIKEIGVKLPISPELKGLRYKFVPEKQTIDGYGKPMSEPPHASLISAQLKDQPSSCGDSSGVIASISRGNEQPVGPDGAPYPQEFQKKIGGIYYALDLPNGGPCFDDPPLSNTEASQRKSIQEAFKTLAGL